MNASGKSSRSSNSPSTLNHFKYKDGLLLAPLMTKNLTISSAIG